MGETGQPENVTGLHYRIAAGPVREDDRAAGLARPVDGGGPGFIAIRRQVAIVLDIILATVPPDVVEERDQLPPFGRGELEREERIGPHPPDLHSGAVLRFAGLTPTL